MGLPIEFQKKLWSKWPSGRLNLITDVADISVGHVTLQEGEINTGVTAILPHQGNLFQDKVMAGASVLNGFGKSVGLVQVEELGSIETPIILTNTLSVGTASTALIRYSLERNEDIGVTTGTVNPIVTECNDGRLNDIRGLHVTEAHVLEALAHTGKEFEEGTVGGGTGMVCLGLKGGIGSASRVVTLSDGSSYTIGALVMSNFGSAGNLVIGGEHVGRRILEEEIQARLEQRRSQRKDRSQTLGAEKEGGASGQDGVGAARTGSKDQGSIIMILATDAPLNERQLKRVAKRSMAALGRVGSYCGNGSGDIAICFTTANRMPHYSKACVLDMKMIYDEEIDPLFEGGVEAVEEAIISSLYHARTTSGVRGNTYKALREYL